MWEKVGMSQNKRPYIVVITGSIATGKSTASNIIKKLGYQNDGFSNQCYCS